VVVRRIGCGLRKTSIMPGQVRCGHILIGCGIILHSKPPNLLDEPVLVHPVVALDPSLRLGAAGADDPNPERGFGRRSSCRRSSRRRARSGMRTAGSGRQSGSISRPRTWPPQVAGGRWRRCSEPTSMPTKPLCCESFWRRESSGRYSSMIPTCTLTYTPRSRSRMVGKEKTAEERVEVHISGRGAAR
jgi:hypothetical protein